jgi:hypothetical protein
MTEKAEADGAAGSVFDREWAYYMENRDEIVQKYRDKYVVISGNRVVAAYDDEDIAFDETVRHIPPGSFMLHHVTEPEKVIRISPLFL